MRTGTIAAAAAGMPWPTPAAGRSDAWFQEPWFQSRQLQLGVRWNRDHGGYGFTGIRISYTMVLDRLAYRYRCIYRTY